MKSTTHPNLFLGIFSLLLLFIAVGLRANSYRSGNYVFLAAIILGGIHWIWSMIDVFKDYRTTVGTENKKIIWVILILLVPPVGGILYYGLGRKVAF